MDILTWYFGLPDWAMFLVALPIVTPLAMLYAWIFKGDEPTPRALHSGEQQKIDDAFDFVEHEKTKEAYKKLGSARHKNKIKMDPAWLAGAALLVVLIFVLLSAVKAAFPGFMEPKPTQVLVPVPGMPGMFMEVTPTPVATQIPAQTETVQAPDFQSTNPTPLPKLPQAVAYAAQIKEDGIYGKVGYWFTATEDTLKLFKTLGYAQCGEEVNFESDDVYAIVYTDDIAPNATITATPNGVIVSCEYGTVIYAETIK